MMKKLLTLLLTLALCLPVVALADDVTVENFDFTGEWYTVRMLTYPGTEMDEQPMSAADLDQEMASAHGLDHAVMYALSDEWTLWAVFEDGKLADGLIAAPGVAMLGGIQWSIGVLRDNESLGVDNLYTYDPNDFVTVDGKLCIRTRDNQGGEVTSQVLILSENVFRFREIGKSASTMFIRKTALDAAAAQ